MDSEAEKRLRGKNIAAAFEWNTKEQVSINYYAIATQSLRQNLNIQEATNLLGREAPESCPPCSHSMRCP